MISWFKYVRFVDVPAHEEKGWVVECALDCHHGHYSVFMSYPESWEPINGYEGLYDVSNHGRIRSHDRSVATLAGGKTWSTRTIKGRILVCGKIKDGYLGVSLSDSDGNKSGKHVAHLVAQAFIGPRPSGYDVCHNDGCRTNNFAFNLRYDTRKANMADAAKHGTIARGNRCKQAKLTENLVRDIRVLATKRETTQIAKELQVSVSTISNVLAGRVWKHIPIVDGEVGSPSGDALRAEFIRTTRAGRLVLLNQDHPRWGA